MDIVVVLTLDLARSLGHGAPPTPESRALEAALGNEGVELRPLFPDIEPAFEAMVKQFSGQLPDETVDRRLDKIRSIPGVEAAYKKPPAELPSSTRGPL